MYTRVSSKRINMCLPLLLRPKKKDSQFTSDHERELEKGGPRFLKKCNQLVVCFTAGRKIPMVNVHEILSELHR